MNIKAEKRIGNFVIAYLDENRVVVAGTKEDKTLVPRCLTQNPRLWATIKAGDKYHELEYEGTVYPARMIKFIGPKEKFEDLLQT